MYSKFISFILSFVLLFNLTFPVLAQVEKAQVSTPKYPDYARMYVGEDKFEGFNRKMFNLNSRLNKYIARPVHILWASIMPQYGMDRIQSAYNNIEYPKRLASCLLQKDGEGVKNETIRFLTNSTIGLGGLFDPASKLLKVKPTTENMEQALCKCKMKSGSYMVMPVLNACTPRSLCGRAIEAALDPSVYLATPITALVKFGLMVNRTSYMQPLAQMLESTYADPYDIQKKLYGIENYIKNANLDRQNLLETEAKLVEEDKLSALAEEITAQTETQEDEVGEITGAAADIDELEIIQKPELTPDILLEDFKPQSPIVDSMRTALFDNPEIDKSIWNELSIWNRSFAKRIKTSSVAIVPERDEYKFRYILQKDKNAPLIILYPSIGEGYNTHHSTVFAKMFFDEGYSIVMLGSHFHWEFVRSMPEGYCPGIPSQDADNIKLVTHKILDKLENKYECKFDEKIIIGRTDLAKDEYEKYQGKQLPDFGNEEFEIKNISVTKNIVGNQAATILQKQPGNYYTIDLSNCNIHDTKTLEDIEHTLATVLKDMLEELHLVGKKAFVVGLGNSNVTPDAIGPYVIDNTIVTRHLYLIDALSEGFSCVSAMSPGVMGTTGIETYDIIESMIKKIDVDFVIVVDALATNSIKRINKTIQLTISFFLHSLPYHVGQHIDVILKVIRRHQPYIFRVHL